MGDRGQVLGKIRLRQLYQVRRNSVNRGQNKHRSREAVFGWGIMRGIMGGGWLIGGTNCAKHLSAPVMSCLLLQIG